MNKKLITIVILFLAVTVFAGYLLVSGKKNSINQPVTEHNAPQLTNANSVPEMSDIILYYGDGCPHCALVEKFIEDNNINAKVSFAKKEVYYNKQNSNEMAEKAQKCGMPTDSIGVPFLWDGSKCLVGDQDVIEFFKSEANVQ